MYLDVPIGIYEECNENFKNSWPNGCTTSVWSTGEKLILPRIVNGMEYAPLLKTITSIGHWLTSFY